MTTSEGKPPDATQGLRDMVTNLKIESAQLAKSKTAVGQAGGTWLSRVARELEALLPALDAAIREGRLKCITLEEALGIVDLAYSRNVSNENWHSRVRNCLTTYFEKGKQE